MATQLTTKSSRPVAVPTISPAGFVGRDREIGLLAEALAQPPAVVLIEGEAGVGKSRLLRELQASLALQGTQMLTATCPPFREPLTLGAVVDAVRQASNSVRGLELTGLAGALRPLFPEWATDLPVAPEPAEDASAARHRLFCALAELFACLEVGVLVVEDVHWADDATLEFLLFLTSRRPQPVSLVVTYRPEDVPTVSLVRRLSAKAPAAATLTRIPLVPLDVTHTAALVSSMLNGERLSEGFVGFLHQRTDGVPLAVEESVRLLYDRADLVRRDGEWVRVRLADLQVPPSVRDSTVERVARLPAAAQGVLHAAAVLVAPVGEEVLGAVSGVAGSAGVADALAAGLLVEDDRSRLAFRHALPCRAVYEAMPATERRRLHLAAGEALEGTHPLPVVQLARHFKEAGDSGRWCQYGKQAVDVALASGDEATAAVLLHDLVVHADLPPGDVARLVKKIPLQWSSGDSRLQELVQALRSVLNGGALEHRDEAEVRAQLGRVLMTAQDWDAGRAQLEQAIPHLGKDAAASTMILLGWPIGSDCPAAEHLRWLRRAATARVSAGPAQRLQMLVDRVTALLTLGEQDGWVEANRIPNNASTGEGLRVTCGHYNVGELAMLWGRYAEARQWLTSGLALAEAGEYHRFRDAVVVTLAHVDLLTGSWQGLAKRVHALAGCDDAVTRIEARLVHAQLQAATGLRAQAEEQLELVAEQIGKHGGLYLVEPAAALARLRLVDDRVPEALSVTDAPMTIVARKGVWIWATDIGPARVDALVAAGRYEDAAELVTAFGRGLRGRDVPASRAALLLCRAVLAEHHSEPSRAAAGYARAARAWDSLPRPLDALLARERQARCLLAAGRFEAAVSLLSQIFEGLSGLGAASDADRLAHRLHEHGVQVRRPGPGGRPAYGDQLSPRERDVLRLLVTGRTDRQIAEALFLSPRTVGRHLDSARRKLKAPSRTALAVTAVESGVLTDDRLARTR